MKVYVVLGYDDDEYTYETFEGVYRTREEANNFIKNDYWVNCDGEKIPEHEEYKIIVEEI